MSYQEVAPDTYVVTDEAYHMSNVLVAKMTDGTVLIASSPFETQGAENLIQWIKKEFAPKKIVAINTHHHFDGTGGNAAFKKNGVEIWASQLTRNLYLKNVDTARWSVAKDFGGELGKRMERNTISPADNIFKARDGLLLNYGGENIEVIYPGPGHTMDNMVVYIPSRKVLFGGCMVRPQDKIGPLKEADLDQWENSIEALIALRPEIVIPGHGPVGSTEQLHNTINLVQKTRSDRQLRQ